MLLADLRGDGNAYGHQLETVSNVVAACVVLHNMCEMFGDNSREEWVHQEETSVAQPTSITSRYNEMSATAIYNTLTVPCTYSPEVVGGLLSLPLVGAGKGGNGAVAHPPPIIIICWNMFMNIPCILSSWRLLLSRHFSISASICILFSSHWYAFFSACSSIMAKHVIISEASIFLLMSIRTCMRCL